MVEVGFGFVLRLPPRWRKVLFGGNILGGKREPKNFA
jgi:hypothetical protein